METAPLVAEPSSMVLRAASVAAGKGGYRHCRLLSRDAAGSFRSVPPHYLRENILDRTRRYAELYEPGSARRCHGVDLHQLHLIAGERRARQQLREPGFGADQKIF